MLGVSEEQEISGLKWENEVGKTVTVVTEESNEDEGDRLLPVNRWPQQETLALLNIRSNMDVAFRDSGAKAYLWDEVSRRMAELGYDRSAKKCKEKFENIHKYHKRVKNGSYGRSNGRTYRFFDQLEALDQQQIVTPTSAGQQVNTSMQEPSLTVKPISSNPEDAPLVVKPLSVHTASNPDPTSTASTSSSRSESEGVRKKKRKWADFSDKLMRSMLKKQEEMQKKFLEAIDQFERDRLAREEEWKTQEMARIKREHDLLMQERSISAAKDAAILAFLQKISEQNKSTDSQGQMEEDPSQETSNLCRNEKDSGENSSSRWPKEEVESLIKIRSNLDLEYQRNGPKGPLWEDVSIAMKKIGYDRSAKRCKEKWENINKYYRRVKDNNKERPIDSKTCPYFHLLDALYSKKIKRLDNDGLDSSTGNLRPEELLLHMMNHHSGSQHEQGELISDHEPFPNGNDNEDENEDAV